jgi:quercetin dioxygenase-like cupin family protein
MPHVTHASTRSHRLHGVTFTSFINSEAGSADLAAWLAEFPPGTPAPAHTMSSEEVLYVLHGTLDIEIDDERFVAGAGDAAVVPAGACFRIGNSGSEPARA